jgi:hypothetical protein
MAMMPPIPPVPPPDVALLIRTDFSDDIAWTRLCELLQRPSYGQTPKLLVVNDQVYAGLAPETLAQVASDEPELTYAFMADSASMASTEASIAVVDLADELGRSFRVTPEEVITILANLELGNVDFYEFADTVDDDGVYRGGRHRRTP